MASPRHSNESVVTEAVVAFLKNVPPFQFLSREELTKLTRHVVLEFFPKNTLILSAGSPTSESLYVVHKGAVKLSLDSRVGKELILDMRCEGEIFGLLSVMGKDVARLDVTAVEDTLCYTIPAAEIHGLISNHAEVANYFLRTSITRYMDRTLEELRTQTNLLGDTERQLYSLSAGEVLSAPILLCSEETTIQEAAKMMAARKARCIFVTDAKGAAIGIVTHRDFADKVVALRSPLDGRVSQIMSRPVISVETTERVFHALLAMVSRNIHHVLVVQEGMPAGVLTAHDLMVLQGKSPLNVARYLESQTDVNGLAGAQSRISGLFPLLLREGAKASHVTRVVAELNDRLIAKILEFAHAELGDAPVPYCWVALGSEGRREQTFKTDQDNALIYADEADVAARDYFKRLASFVHDALEKIGYPSCPGEYVARNPRWCQPLQSWLGYFRAWISEAHLFDVQDALILFDMRPVAGEFALFESLLAGRRECMTDAGMFKSVLAFVSIGNKPPLGFFRNLVLESGGEHKDQLDLKLVGTGPIVNAVRLFALHTGIELTNTLDRLAALLARQDEHAELYQDLYESFEFLSLLRLEHQLQQVRENRALSNYIAPETLTHLQRSLLKEAFRTSARAQSVIEDTFRTAIWPQLRR